MADEWREVRVGDLVDRGALMISDGYRVRNEELGTEGVPFVRGGDIGDGWINTITKDYIRPELIGRVRQKLTQAGDAAFITKGTVGRAGWLRPEQPRVVFAPQVAYWRVTDASVLDPGFIFYLMRSYEFQSALDGVKTHGAMAADYVSISQQYDFRFRFPGVKAQAAIAHVLGTLDDKIELNRRMNETLETMARALFKSWFVDFDPVRAKAEGRDPGLPRSLADLFPDRLADSDLGEVPEGWEVRPLDELAEFLNGLPMQKYPAIDPVDSLPVIKIAELRNGVTARTDRASRNVPEKYIIEDGDFLFSWSGSLLAKFWTAGEGALNQHLYKVTSGRYPMWFVSQWVLHHLEEFQAVAASKATTMGHIQRGHLKAALTTCPHGTVLERIGTVMAPLVDRGNQGTLESRTLAALRDTLLPKLISGELRVKDAERFVETAQQAKA